VLGPPEFRRLWIGRSSSKLADRFYQSADGVPDRPVRVTDTPQDTELWPRLARPLRLDFEDPPPDDHAGLATGSMVRRIPARHAPGTGLGLRTLAQASGDGAFPMPCAAAWCCWLPWP